jgi:small-conductance mechanosensitive channel
MNVESWLNPQFWGDIVRDTVEWSLRAAPRMLVLALGLFLALKVLRLALRRLRMHLLARSDGATAEVIEHEKRLDTLIGIARKVAVIAIWSMFAMLLLVEIGINVGPLIAGAGVLGLAIGFGAQELVRDVISGFFILLENHLRNGDVAVINGTGGLVESIGLRTITLRDLSGTVHVFQNGKVDTLANMTKQWSAMVFDIGVAYKEDTDKVADVIREVAEELRQDAAFAGTILEPMEIFGVDALGDSAVVIKARLKTVPSEQWSVGREYRRRLKYAFDQRGIEIPFPHRTLYWGDQVPKLALDASSPQGSQGNGRDHAKAPS